MASDYHQHSSLNWSRLKEILNSPRQFQYRNDVPQMQTPVMALGSATHLAILQPELFDVEAMIAPDEYVTATGMLSTAKAAREWRSELPPDSLVVTGAQRDNCLYMRDAVHAHPDARDWLALATIREQPVFWRERIAGMDIDCRGKPDARSESGLLLDLKTLGGISPFSLYRCVNDIARRHHHGAAAFYERGILACGGRVERHGWIFVESRAPFDVACLEADDDMQGTGRELAETALARYAAALLTQSWPGVAPSKMIVSLPLWARSGDESLDDIGLTGFAEEGDE